MTMNDDQWCRDILESSTDPDHAVDRFTSYALVMLVNSSTEDLAEAREALLQIRARKFHDRARFERG